jgi:hypothetical protein
VAELDELYIPGQEVRPSPLFPSLKIVHAC